MVKIVWKAKSFVVLSMLCILLISAFLPIIQISQAAKAPNVKGFDKGPSYTDVVPMKKATFVNYDKENYLDDYAYLAAIPTAVFNQDDKLFSHPLLFYEDENKYEDKKELSLNGLVTKEKNPVLIGKRF